MNSTQTNKIVNIILQTPQKEWWRATDFMQNSTWFIGYEASACISEIKKQFYYAFDSRQSGKYREIRFKREDLDRLYSGDSMFKYKYLQGASVPKVEQRAEQSILFGDLK